VRVTLAVVAAAMAATGISIASAAPASAGCEPRPLTNYCDKPVRADGSWRRCFYNTPLVDGQGGLFSTGGGNCYDVPGPGLDPYPWAPQEHIDD
jgi:hypothetical protein